MKHLLTAALIATALASPVRGDDYLVECIQINSQMPLSYAFDFRYDLNGTFTLIANDGGETVFPASINHPLIGFVQIQQPEFESFNDLIPFAAVGVMIYNMDTHILRVEGSEWFVEAPIPKASLTFECQEYYFDEGD